MTRGWIAAALGLALAGMPLLAQSEFGTEQSANRGLTIDEGRSPVALYRHDRKLMDAIAGLRPQNAGTVETFVISMAMDSDNVFGREASEAGHILTQRYNANGHSIVLTAGDAVHPDAVSNATPASLAVALGGIAATMDKGEDVLVLFVTTHGAPRVGLAFKDGERGQFGRGLISAQRLSEMLDQFGFRRRLLIISACYSGQFVPVLANDDTVIVTAASAVTSSFGCAPENHWTYFGDALFDKSLRNPVPFRTAVDNAISLIWRWENQGAIQPSNPQVSIGSRARQWLDLLDATMSRAVIAPFSTAANTPGPPAQGLPAGK